MRFDAVLDGERGRLGDAAKLLRLRLVVDMGIAAGVEFDHGRLQADRRFHLPRIGLDEQADPDIRFGEARDEGRERSEEHTSELQSLMRISYAVFCLKKQI